MKSSFKVTVPPHVMARTVGDETVILDLESGTYFGLDPVGSQIWQLISAGKTLAEIHQTLLTEYEVSSEALERDLVRLLDELHSRGLINRS